MSLFVLFLMISLPAFGAPAKPTAPAKAGSAPAAKELAIKNIHYVTIDGIVGVPLEEYIEGVFNDLSGRKETLLVLKMNTPGGLVDSMSQIMSRISEASHPVAVWVAPSGARAASAGAFIVQAAHVAAMAPGTNIGAAHPVVGSGKDIGDDDMKKKITNDLTAKMRAFAQERGRNVAVAESMVRDSVSLTAKEALDKKVIDFIAADEDELLEKLNGRILKIGNETLKLSVKNPEITRAEMPLRLKLLEIFSRPDVAYMALLAGVFLIILELRSPGGFVMGISGAVLLLMASYGLRVLPVNYAGVALLIGGIVVIIADLMIGGIGIVSAAGIGAMLFGGLILFRAPGGELLRVSPVFVGMTTLVIGAIFMIVLRLVYKALRSRPSSGQEGMVGARGIVIDASERKNMAVVVGEYWHVVSVDPEIKMAVGDEVEVVRVESLTLYVKLIQHKEETERQ